ncbi:MAG: Clp protease N-terminal domain-containing protein [Verrucomicrobiae bacterium]
MKTAKKPAKPAKSEPLFTVKCTVKPTVMQRLTPRMQQTLARAAIEADKIGDSYVGTEHFLLAILALEQGTAFRILNATGIGYKETAFAHRVTRCM